jgi:hypothetical protein
MCVKTHRCHINCDILVLIMRIMLFLYILAPHWKHVSYNHCAAAEIAFP